MAYQVKLHAKFVPEWKVLALDLKELVGEVLDHLEDDGPFLGRPEVDTLKGSTHANMKEIRIKHRKESGVLPLRSIRFSVPSFYVAAISRE